MSAVSESCRSPLPCCHPSDVRFRAAKARTHGSAASIGTLSKLLVASEQDLQEVPTRHTKHGKHGQQQITQLFLRVVETVFLEDGIFVWRGVWGRGCDEAEISDEKCLFTE